MGPVLAVTLAGCAVKRTTQVAAPLPALQASLDDLLGRIQTQRAAVRTLNATAQLLPTAGTQYSGVIEEYHDIRTFILAERPARIRLIGQLPIVRKSAFDMVSDGVTFKVYIPSKNKFIVGPNRLERPAKKPIERLRPQHVTDALFLPELDTAARPLLEENEVGGVRYYVVSVVRVAVSTLELEQKFWFDRGDLSLVRFQQFGEGGHLLSDVHYAGYADFGAARYPRTIRLVRPADDYTLEIRIEKLTLNEPIEPEKFSLERPAGTELVEVGKSNAAE